MSKGRNALKKIRKHSSWRTIRQWQKVVGNNLWFYLNKSLWCIHSSRIYTLWDHSVWFIVAEGLLSIGSEIIYLLITSIVTFTGDNVSLSQFKHLSVLCLTLPKIYNKSLLSRYLLFELALLVQDMCSVLLFYWFVINAMHVKRYVTCCRKITLFGTWIMLWTCCGLALVSQSGRRWFGLGNVCAHNNKCSRWL